MEPPQTAEPDRRDNTDNKQTAVPAMGTAVCTWGAGYFLMLKVASIGVGNEPSVMRTLQSPTVRFFVLRL